MISLKTKRLRAGRKLDTPATRDDSKIDKIQQSKCRHTVHQKKSTVPSALWRLGGERLHFLADTSVSKFVSALVACCLIFWSFDRLRVSNISFPPMSRMRVLLVAEEQVGYEGKSGRCWFVWYFVYS